jgi:hypothetical protein
MSSLSLLPPPFLKLCHNPIFDHFIFIIIIILFTEKDKKNDDDDEKIIMIKKQVT